MTAEATLSNPILNSPYAVPSRHWELGAQGPRGAVIDEGAWASLNSTVSRQFPRPGSGRIAVKVINDYGDEVMKVYDV